MTRISSPIYSWPRAAALVGASLAVIAAPPAAADLPRPKDRIEFRLMDSAGKTHELSDYRDRIVVLEWLDPECPVTLRQRTEIAKLSKHYRERGVVWLGVVTKKRVHAKKLEAFRAKHRITYPILIDSLGVVAEQLEVATTRHMFVLRDGKKLYDGAFDNNQSGIEKSPVNYVSRALDEALRGRAVTITYREPYGTSIKRTSMRKKD